MKKFKLFNKTFRSNLLAKNWTDTCNEHLELPTTSVSSTINRARPDLAFKHGASLPMIFAFVNSEV